MTATVSARTTAQDDALANTFASSDPTPSAIETPTPGGSIGRFTILAKLGEGAMGVVYSAYDEQLDRRVAIKILKDVRVSGSDDTALRMRREAQALARLSHPNVVQVYEVGAYEGQVFVAMEYIAGRTLRTWRGEAAFAWQDVVAMYLQAGRGLAAAHAVGLVHRDFKPDNALVGTDGRVRVVDFGLARADAEPAESTEPTMRVPGSHGVLDERLTHTGTIVGTPRYMAPEQYLHASVTARSDQFGFCVALFEALHGVAPFAGETAAALAHQRFTGQLVEVPRDSPVPRGIHDALVRGLSPEPSERWATMDDLLAALTNDPHFAADPEQDLGVARRHRMLLGLAFGVVSVVNMGGVLAYEATRAQPGTTREAMIGGTVGLAISGLLLVLVRRHVFKNTINRQLMLSGITLTVAAWLNRCIGHALDGRLAHVLVTDMLIATAITVVVGAVLLRWVWWVSAVFAVGALAGVLAPHAAPSVLAVCQCATWLLAIRFLVAPGGVAVAAAHSRRSHLSAAHLSEKRVWTG